MKNIILTLSILVVTFNYTFSQTNIVDCSTGDTVMDAPSGTYIKDIHNTFAPFLGTWKYQNGNEILIIKLEKVTKYYYPEYGNYKDFIKGNYSYSTNGNLTYITNTIVSNNLIDDPNGNSFFSSRPITNFIDCSFKDEVNPKPADAKFTFLPNSSTELELKIVARSRGYIYPEVAPTPGFSIPNNIILIKQ